MCCAYSGVPSVRRWNKWIAFLSWLTIITNCTPPGVKMTERSKALHLGLAGNSSSGMHVCACLSCYLFLRLFDLKFKYISQIPFSLGLCIRDHSIVYYDILTDKSVLKHLCNQCSVAEQKLCVLVAFSLGGVGSNPAPVTKHFKIYFIQYLRNLQTCKHGFISHT